MFSSPVQTRVSTLVCLIDVINEYKQMTPTPILGARWQTRVESEYIFLFPEVTGIYLYMSV